MNKLEKSIKINSLNKKIEELNAEIKRKEEMKRIPRALKYSEYIVSFSYETYKGYYKERKRSIYCKDRNECVECFKEWAKKQRTISNVQILCIEKTNKEQKIEI